MNSHVLVQNNIAVRYYGKVYRANPLSSLIMSSDSSMQDIGSVPAKVAMICDMEETDDSVILKLGDIIFNVDDEEVGSFEPQYSKIVSINKTTLKGSGDLITNEDIYSWPDNIYKSIILSYITAVCSLNENVMNYMKTAKFFNSSIGKNNLTINFLNMITFNLLEFEKIINSKNTSIIENGILKENFSLNEANKLHQIVGLPKFAVNLVNELKLEFCLDEIKDLASTIDGNSLNLFFNFIDNMKIILKDEQKHNSYYYGTNFKKFVSDFTTVSKEGYKTTDLINFLLRQNFYFSQRSIFGFPFAEVGFLKDYINMSKMYGIKVEKYPSQLKKQHDILAKNVACLSKLSPELEKQFRNAVAEYADVEKEITVSIPSKVKGTPPTEYSYSFICPRQIKDIIQEGNDLHHCVGSYTDKIINKESRIVFMRLSSAKKESLVTIDIDADYNLVEAAGNANCELDDIQKKALKAWLKEIQSA